MSSSTASYLEISYNGRRRVLFGRWLRGVMPFELQQGYAALLAEAVRHQCRFWVVDLQRRVSVDGNDILWTLEEFFPKLRPQLGSTTYLALVATPPQLVGSLAGLALPPEVTASAEPPYSLQRFTQEEDALRWLRRCRQREQPVAN